MKTPVVFIIFKRPDLTRRAFARIRQARPPKLYILADGPRADKPGEAELCQAARRETEAIDWPCEVIRFHSDKNLGCKENIGGGLNRVFAREERAVILEDDCLADPSFFPFCDAMLERYQDDQKIGQISGLNVLWGRQRFSSSYYFSKYPLIWGWATWADRWQHWDRNLEAWPTMKADADFRQWLSLPQEWSLWDDVFSQLFSKSSPWDTWAYPWTFTTFTHRWLSVAPTRNLVTNTGFANASTHTILDNPSLRPPAKKLQPPYREPGQMVANEAADALTFRTYFLYEEARRWARLRNQLRIKGGKLKQHLGL